MFPKLSTPLRIQNLWLGLLVLAVAGMARAGSADTNGAPNSVTDNKNPAVRPAAPSAPVRALLLGIPHAEVTPQMLVDRIGKKINVVFEISNDWQAILRKPDCANGYDVVVYCPCDPEIQDMELVTNALQTARNGKGTVLLHCALHTFRHVPAWTELLGIRTITHDGYRELTLKKASNHPILKELPETWHTAGDELYAHEYVAKGVTPLLTAYSIQTKSDHVVAWAHTYGHGRVFGTSLGHDLKTVDAVPYQNLLARGLAWAANREYADIALKTLNEIK